MNLNFDLNLRLRLPEPGDPGRQSLYVFNLYRSGSSVVEAVAVSFAERIGGLRPYNLSSALYRLGVEYFDPENYNQSSVHLRDQAQLMRLLELGGYLFYGFREVPYGLSEAFDRTGAAALVVRDPRDIGISHYYAVAKHATSNRIVADQMAALRAQTGSQSLEEYILTPSTLNFLNRIGQCYRPMIERGLPVLRYEDMYVDGAFDLRTLCRAFETAFEPYLPDDWDFEALIARIERAIANSDSLKGHKTGGSIRTYERLDPEVLARYTEALRPSLELLGYEPRSGG